MVLVTIPYARTLTLVAMIAVMLVVAFTGARLAVWESLLPLFEWLQTTWPGRAGRTWGGLFALVQAGHLLGLALLGGAVLLGDGQLLGLWFRDESGIQRQAHRLFLLALIMMVTTGGFMACAVAGKLYYLEVYWYKMLSFGFGLVFALGVRWPFVRAELHLARPGVARLLAVASLMIWFTVAATGRWIGFSG